ncbi:MAG: sigma-54-dependent transcriptional regulator [Dissulfurimicrobium sp.]|uniref:sigma-54-dependent transcriptional regulator n=1 Tax=Dissulfurimicrobium TaxID=1769732 RepID=UPI001EDB3054|nr:sigma-54 dependent transcriptional regulator [Dissulfurimicrobium hydrothermale]UKL13125.1 sigma-54 dependent transcriptional regulator [Dissulfurimicrobium hydrothermale]
MKIMIVDDEPEQIELLSGFLKNQGHDVITAQNGEEALVVFKKTPVQLVFLDHRMPGMTGDEVLKRLKVINPLVHAIIITAYGAVDTAVRAMKLGADDFLEKPVDLTDLIQKIQEIDERVSVEEDIKTVRDFMDDGYLPDGIIANSLTMKEVVSIAYKIARTPWAVLISGETGTGKEVMARLIHGLSDRKGRPFIEINCAAIPENLFESELFGHERGAFTGAVSLKRGKFELARGGTLFLDEIGEMPLALQPKLLRVLQEGRITRVGSEKDAVIDVRVLAATNRDLKGMSKIGQFREDLYYRLNVFEIEMPPLRQRKEDIPLLIDFFVRRYAQRPIDFSPDALDVLMKYPYPGNVRELEHIIQRTVTLLRGKVIRPSDLPDEIRAYQGEDIGILNARLDAVERRMIISALEQNGWNQTKAAAQLGISERVIRYKIQKHGIIRPR